MIADRPPSPELLAALADAQRLGMLGDRPVSEVVVHAWAFVEALHERPGPVLDLGSGGGVPGLVIADARPDVELTLLDRRAKRTDFLQRVVSRLGWTDRVRVVTADAGRVEVPTTHDAVVARGFGPAVSTLRTARRFLAPGGLIVLSEPPGGDRWADVDLRSIGVHRKSWDDARVVCFEVTA